MLVVDQLEFAYGGKKILEGVSFSVSAGEIIALIGISGSGKTTLFRLIAGLLSPLQGNILINGLFNPEGAHVLTYMRQEDLLLPWRTVMENLLLFSELGSRGGSKGSKDPTLTDRAKFLLERVGLYGVRFTLSKGVIGRDAAASGFGPRFVAKSTLDAFR